MIYRHVFQRSRSMPGKQFLVDRLKGAVGYDRIAGYFDSSLFELAGEALESVQGLIRIVCNSDIQAKDVEAASAVVREQAQRQSFFKHDPAILSQSGSDRFTRLARLLKGSGTARLEVRVLPDDAFGLVHGKAGLITYADGRRISFLGSTNETFAGWALNYELLWEDDSPEACDWVAAEFERLWNHPLAMPLSQAVVKEVDRLSRRFEIPVGEWQNKPEPASLAVESPVYREQFGLWPHQKYFVSLAWRAHQVHGARFVLADQVGLGKTVQLGMVAQLIALTSDKPVLVLLPKTLMEQWQIELWDLLQVPSARWTGTAWIDELGFEYVPSSKEPLLACPRKIGLVSQGLVIRNPERLQNLLEREWSCVIVDEAHRARRKKIPPQDERGPGIRNPETECNRLYSFLYKLAGKTRSLLLATATPVQLHPIEAWDLLFLLSQGNPHILGEAGSYWLNPEKALPLALGEVPFPEEDDEAWPWVKNPFPPSWERPEIKTLRQQNNLDDTRATFPLSFQELRPADKTRAKTIISNYVNSHTPFLRSIVRRTRGYLEQTINPDTKEPYLSPIGVELFGEDDPVPLDGYFAEAYKAAEDFSRLLAKRIHASGFLKTLLLRRLGSSIEAGKKTIEAMLSHNPQEDSEDDTDEIENETTISEDTLSELYPLTAEETELLHKCYKLLCAAEREDPKWQVIEQYIKNWKAEGCILFSQYFDTAYWAAQKLTQLFPNEPIGLYAGSRKSLLLLGTRQLKKDREELKRMVKQGELQILVGTDAASEGLNLQTLGTLINIDLPWNPTKLEQRKGRIQRIGQRRASVKILNLRYEGSVEDRVHEVLSDRLQEIFKLFGQIPDIVEDIWIDIALGDTEKAKQELDRIPKTNPFDDRYSKIDRVPDWESCETVVNKLEKIELLKKGWS
ncbi:MAG TPA: helicase-related protein [Termitinemataceae bacterium]|nr:helicase-related protein [Termitinemataceae bacterium]HOM24037.1 helicase-related protein [Termitinemataceae bacterium]HPQ00969.1 helicase-related protein [Termitinemataceae bacterium]